MKMIHLTMVLAKKVSISSDPANVLLSYPNACLSNVCSMNMRSFFDCSKNAISYKGCQIEPTFYSDRTQFTVTLPNLNYHAKNQDVAIDVAIDKLHVTAPTKEKIRLIFSQIGPDGTFGRKEITGILGISQTSAGNLINKLKKAGIVEAVSGLGKGKYKFRT